jgi:murein L,D-transpeptidase YcbB/YkuD
VAIGTRKRFPPRWLGAAAAVALAGAAAGGARSDTVAALQPAEREAMLSFLQSSGRGASLVPLSDDLLIKKVLQAAQIELGQRLQPSEVDREWAIEPAHRDIAAELAAARAQGRVAAWLSQLAPSSAEYHALQAAEQRYRTLAVAGWPSLPAGLAVRPGEHDAQVPLLRARLKAEGFETPAQQDAEWLDPGTAAALRAFQTAHDLKPDGVLGRATRLALNVPAEARLAQIDANLERRRWMPRQLPADRLEVDVGGAEATLFHGRSPALQMRVVVGDPRHHTPMFASRVEAVIFNPPWNVPGSIAAKEILPKARRDPGYLDRNGFHLVDGRLQQAPGPKNALGAVKFDLPSPFGVYLHDTPGKAAFLAPNRALSHGCMRLEKPRELAAVLLAPQGGTRETVDQAIASGETQRVELRKPVPLYVVYWTVATGPDGAVLFRQDPYRWDRKLVAALAAPTWSAAADGAAHDTDCAVAASPARLR